jgi:hypothetical protein
MKDEINLKIRSEVMTFALQMERNVNALLLSYLGITDKTKTKNFGHKAGISFKSKIDLLFDIGVFTKEEHMNLELLMNFRNKFLHDIDCCSFEYALDTFDNGIQNRFKKFIDSTFTKNNEAAYENACSNLYLFNAKMLMDKLRQRTETIEKRQEFMVDFLNGYEFAIEEALDFCKEIFEIAKRDEFENESVIESANTIL